MSINILKNFTNVRVRIQILTRTVKFTKSQPTNQFPAEQSNNKSQKQNRTTQRKSACALASRESWTAPEHPCLVGLPRNSGKTKESTGKWKTFSQADYGDRRTDAVITTMSQIKANSISKCKDNAISGSWFSDFLVINFHRFINFN